MKKGRPASKQGFTLLEILISVVILAAVSVLIAQVLFTTTHVNTKSTLSQDIKQNGEFALDVMSRAVRSSQGWNTNCTVGQTTSSSVVLSMSGTDTITYSCVSDGVSARIASTSGTGTVTFLTNNNVTLSASNGIGCSDSTLTFTCPATSSNKEALTISFTLSQRNDSTSVFENAKNTFESSVILRNQ